MIDQTQMYQFVNKFHPRCIYRWSLRSASERAIKN